MNRALRLVHVLPDLGGAMDGVADYARVLGATLLRREGIMSRYLCGNPAGPPLAGAATGDPASRVRRRSAAGLVEALEQCEHEFDNKGPVVMLVHYVNYGYAARGCPFWLIRGLETWRRGRGARLVTMFHELFAFGPPWRSAFWLSPVQRFLAHRLFALSDAVVTNREQSRRWLRAGTSRSVKRTKVMPVFSCLGEPERLPDWTERQPRMVVAGRSGSLDRAYGRCREQLLRACDALGIEEIVDIGARTDPVPSRIRNIKVTAMGHLAPGQASALLGGARAGFIDYPSDYLGKSTVFAAYAAHGLVPVVSWRRGEDEPGLAEGESYWVPSSGNAAGMDFKAIAQASARWYTDHGLAPQARAYADLLRGGAA